MYFWRFYSTTWHVWDDPDTSTCTRHDNSYRINIFNRCFKSTVLDSTLIAYINLHLYFFSYDKLKSMLIIVDF